MELPAIFERRASYSLNRLNELRRRLANFPQLNGFHDLTIVAAGSYGRLEASDHSDIDVFFFLHGDGEALKEPRTQALRLFGRLV